MEPNDTKKIKLALWFWVKGDLRFLSHRDTIRLWQRVLSRCRVPVRFSRGFNPHMRFSLPLPRSVGMSSLKELLLLELDQKVDTTELICQLQKHLPVGIEVFAAAYVPAEVRAVPQWARYQIIPGEQVDTADLTRRIGRFKEASSWPLERGAHGRHRQRRVDVRAGVTELDVEDGNLFCTIKVEPEGTVRINEILEVLEINDMQLIRKITRIGTGYPGELSPDN